MQYIHQRTAVGCRFTGTMGCAQHPYFNARGGCAAAEGGARQTGRYEGKTADFTGTCIRCLKKKQRNGKELAHELACILLRVKLSKTGVEMLPFSPIWIDIFTSFKNSLRKCLFLDGLCN